MLKLDYSKLDLDMIKKHIEDLYEIVDGKVTPSWFPTKSDDNFAHE